MPEKKMSIREYREYAKKHYGKQSLNESMLKFMDKAADGKDMTSKEFDHLQATIKAKQAISGK